MSKTQLSLLVELARIDGEVADEELKIIHQIGAINGLTSHEIAEIIDNPEPEPDKLDHLTEDERFEYIYSIVLLMKADGKLYNEEIQFTSRLATKLGYDETVLIELLTKVYSDERINANKEEVKVIVQNYLKAL